MRRTILLADNSPVDADSLRQSLEHAGFHVVVAKSPEEAAERLRHEHVSVAVLDLRLRNDNDPEDLSGLAVAQNSPPEIPKIILSHYPSFEAAREALSLGPNALPPAVAFVSKADGPDRLIEAIKRVTRLEHSYRAITDVLLSKLDADYADARRQTTVSFFAGAVMGFAGMGTLLFAAFHPSDHSWLSVLAAVIPTAVGTLFYRRSDAANERMDRYHRERLDVRRLETLLSVCDGLDSIERQDAEREHLLAAVTARWFAPESDVSPAKDSAKPR